MSEYFELPGRCFLDLDSAGNLVRCTGLAYSTGQADAFKIIMTNTEGMLDQRLLPDNLQPGETMLTAQALAAGDWVSVILENGRRKVVRATAISSERPPCGFVVEAYGINEMAQVYFRGMNTRADPSGTGIQDADTGKDVYLSFTTPGKSISASTIEGAWDSPTGMTLGVVLYSLGAVIEYTATAMRVAFTPKHPIQIQAITT